MSQAPLSTRVLVVGAGPVGLEVADALSRAGVPYLQVDRGQIGSTIARFPTGMTFFSSNDRLELCGLPLQTVGQRKSTKEEYLAYLRSVARARDLPVRTFEEVTEIDRRPEGGFEVHTRRAGGGATIRADALVLATGDMAAPRRLGIPGEELPHVDDTFRDPHRYFRQRLLVVGGRNGAVEAALRCWHAGARVAISYRRAAFPERSVKYWLLPELVGRIRRGEIEFHPESVPEAITETGVVLRGVDGTCFDVPADFVLLQVGYRADMSLFAMAGVELVGEGERPRHCEETMETNVPGVYVAGTASAGSQQSYSVFIENCHIHAARIAAALTGCQPPPSPPPLTTPES